MDEIQKLKVQIWDLKEDYKKLKAERDRLEVLTNIKEKTIAGIHNCKYDLRGNLYFTAGGIQYKMDQKNALEIAYTLIDSLGLDYKILDQVDEAVNSDQE